MTTIDEKPRHTTPRYTELDHIGDILTATRCPNPQKFLARTLRFSSIFFSPTNLFLFCFFIPCYFVIIKKTSLWFIELFSHCEGNVFLWLVGLWKRLAIDLLNDRQQLHRQIRFRPGLNIMKSYNFLFSFFLFLPRAREKSLEKLSFKCKWVGSRCPLVSRLCWSRCPSAAVGGQTRIRGHIKCQIIELNYRENLGFLTNRPLRFPPSLHRLRGGRAEMENRLKDGCRSNRKQQPN